MQKTWFNPWVGKILWRRGWQPTPVILPGESHGQSSLGGYSPWGSKESDTTERLTPLLNTFSDWTKIPWTHWDLEEKVIRKQEFMKKNKLLQNVSMIQFSVLQTSHSLEYLPRTLRMELLGRWAQHSLKATSKMKFQSPIKTS